MKHRSIVFLPLHVVIVAILALLGSGLAAAGQAFEDVPPPTGLSSQVHTAVTGPPRESSMSLQRGEPHPVFASITIECTPAPNMDLSGCVYNGEDLGGADFSGAILTGATFNGANLANANFTGATLTGATFNGANLPCAIFDNADVTAATFDGANLLGASFIDAIMTSSTYGSATTCPDGSVSGANTVAPNTCDGHLIGVCGPAATVSPSPTGTVTPTATTPATGTETPIGSETPGSTSVATDTPAGTETPTTTSPASETPTGTETPDATSPGTETPNGPETPGPSAPATDTPIGTESPAPSTTVVPGGTEVPVIPTEDLPILTPTGDTPQNEATPVVSGPEAPGQGTNTQVPTGTNQQGDRQVSGLPQTGFNAVIPQPGLLVPVVAVLLLLVLAGGFILRRRENAS